MATYFSGGTEGDWLVRDTHQIIGQTLPHVTHLKILNGTDGVSDSFWTISGVSSHARYTHRAEKIELNALQASLGRSEATCGALIPIKKSEEWWSFTQDERRNIFENKSKHIANSLKYLPAIARKLYHSRDLGEPFDFITWFEFSPTHVSDFNNLLAELRASEEWKYVVREVDIRVVKAPKS